MSATVDTRPRFHHTAHTGWVNDPLALTWHGGKYHLFYQYVPGETTWGPNCSWGHATSIDLVSWEEQEVALAPGDGDDGIWSGSIAVANGHARLFYTSVSVPDFSIGRIRVAEPVDDSWSTWVKKDVVASAPQELDVKAFRDPFVFRDGDSWRMLVGTSLGGSIAAASSFSSPDLNKWTFDGLAAERPGSATEPVWTGTLWECPQIFAIDGRHVLITSVWEDDVLHYVAYAVGSYVAGAFTADAWGRLSYGDSYYAPSLFRDRAGDPGLIFWLRGISDAENTWASALSVPHTLSLDGDVLIARPHGDLESYAESIPADAADAGPVDIDGAAIVDWRSPVGASLTLECEKGPIVRLLHASTGYIIENLVARTTVTIPTAEDGVRIVLDEAVIEISTAGGVYAAAIHRCTRVESNDPAAHVRVSVLTR